MLLLLVLLLKFELFCSKDRFKDEGLLLISWLFSLILLVLLLLNPIFLIITPVSVSQRIIELSAAALISNLSVWKVNPVTVEFPWADNLWFKVIFGECRQIITIPSALAVASILADCWNAMAEIDASC